jgi:hypothetical protein
MLQQVVPHTKRFKVVSVGGPNPKRGGTPVWEIYAWETNQSDPAPPPPSSIPFRSMCFSWSDQANSESLQLCWINFGWTYATKVGYYGRKLLHDCVLSVLYIYLTVIRTDIKSSISWYAWAWQSVLIAGCGRRKYQHSVDSENAW